MKGSRNEEREVSSRTGNIEEAREVLTSSCTSVHQVADSCFGSVIVVIVFRLQTHISRELLQPASGSCFHFCFKFGGSTDGTKEEGAPKTWKHQEQR